MTEIKFYNQLGPGTKDKMICDMDKKLRYESRKVVLDQALKI